MPRDSIEPCVAPYTVANGRDPARFHDGHPEELRPLWGKEVGRLFDYWSDICQGSRFPSRIDIDPLDIAKLLPYVFLGDIDPAGPEYTYRLAGEEIVAVFNRYNGQKGLSGVKLGDSLPPDKAEMIRNRWRPLVENRAAIYMRGLVYSTLDSFALGERLILPLSNSGDLVDGFLGLTACHWHKKDSPAPRDDLDIYYIDPATFSQ